MSSPGKDQVIFVDSDRWYSLKMNGEGQMVLEVVKGTIALYTVEVVLNDEQLEEYRNQGKPYLDVLALKVCKGWKLG